MDLWMITLLFRLTAVFRWCRVETGWKLKTLGEWAPQRVNRLEFMSTPSSQNQDDDRGLHGG